ncbi:MAG: hypothetical protein ABI200_04270 [Gaiellales bacterium]
MSGIIGGLAHGASTGGASLATQLDDIAAAAGRAATFAQGEYIPQLSRPHELKTAFRGAAQATAKLEALAPRIAQLDGGEDGLRLAKAAIDNLDGGRNILRDGVAIEDDIPRGGGVVADMVATTTAGSMFRDASDSIGGIAALARVEATSVDELFAAITRAG